MHPAAAGMADRPHGLLLFQPPYNADSMPASLAEARPIAQATDLGYITVEKALIRRIGAGPKRTRSLTEVRRHARQGNTILLHDAGGDRQQTVDALPHILDSS